MFFATPLCGSIPAGAGEPLPAVYLPTTRRVYPRGCGGARSSAQRHPDLMGLSPRVRGSRPRNDLENHALGSIPAGAGEPQSAHVGLFLVRVYPRGCGGAALCGTCHCADNGLSPRVRGSHKIPKAAASSRGSIPAGAGEPSFDMACMHAARVYPRGCGGAPEIAHASHPAAGLSPRVRGSRIGRSSRHPQRRSIPAGAGEPVPILLLRSKPMVYPRGCGGAHDSRCAWQFSEGLSPRVRGSPASDGHGQRQ